MADESSAYIIFQNNITNVANCDVKDMLTNATKFSNRKIIDSLISYTDTNKYQSVIFFFPINSLFINFKRIYNNPIKLLDLLFKIFL